MRIGVERKWQAPVLVLLLLFTAILLRLPGYDGRAFWVDELWRVNLILDPGAISRYWKAPDVYTAITAPLYLALNNLLGEVNASPWCLRLSSLLPGLVVVVLAFAIARRSGGGLVWASGAAALFVANSHFIQYSNEFKPYMFEVAVHLACTYLWVDLITSNPSDSRKWIVLCMALLVAAFGTANIVFVLPAMALSLADKVWVQERGKLKLLFAIFLAVGFTVAGLYFFVWSYGSDKGLISYWADGFHDATREGYPTFVVRRLQGLWHGAFSVVGARHGMAVVSGIGLLCGVYVWSRRRIDSSPLLRGLMIYTLVLVLTLLALNKAGLWPIGEIRPNLFLFAILAVLWVLLLGALLPLWVQRGLGGLMMAVAIAGAVQTSRDHFAGLGPPIEQSDRVWAAFDDSAPAGKKIVEQCKVRPAMVFLNPAMSHADHYFAAFGGGLGKPNVLTDPCTVVVPVPDAYANPELLRSRLSETRSYEGTQWYAYSHLNVDEVNKLKTIAQEFGSLVYEQSFEGAGYFAVMVKKSSE